MNTADESTRPESVSSTDQRSPGGTDPLSTDEIFHLLQTRRRRDALRFLLDADGPVTMRTVAERVAAREYDTSVDDLTSAQRQRVYISLYQSHLPKLDRDGIVKYDQDRGVVTPTARIEIFEPYLDGSHDDDGTSIGDAYYVGASSVSTALLLFVSVGRLAIPGVVLGALIVALFTVPTVLTALQ